MSDALSTLIYPGIPITQKTIAAAAISTTYAIVGSAFSSPPVLIVIISTLDQAVQLSWDGVNDHLAIVAGSTIVLDLKSDGICLAAGYAPFVKEIGNPTTGNLYICGFTV